MSLKAEEALGCAIDYVDKTIGGSGALKGEDGFSPIIVENSKNTADDYRLDIETAFGKITTVNLKGKDGDKGDKGDKGKDGITYVPRIKTVNTVDSLYSASASLDINNSDNTANLTLNLPRGKNGDYVPENNAGAHNSIYRGMYLGDTVTDEQYASISAGTFEDLYIGDYWTIGDINYRIAAFDYFYNSGDTHCTTHHAVIVPDTSLYNAQMNSTVTTAGGYVGSEMYKTNLASAKTTIKNAFNGHVLSHRVYLVNAVSNGKPSAGVWCDSEVNLMNEQMVCGGAIFMSMSNGSTIPTNNRVDKSQLPLFAYEPSRIFNRLTWWLRDTVSASTFAFAGSNGYMGYGNSNSSFAVRPYFCIS